MSAPSRPPCPAFASMYQCTLVRSEWWVVSSSHARTSPEMARVNASGGIGGVHESLGRVRDEPGKSPPLPDARAGGVDAGGKDSAGPTTEAEGQSRIHQEEEVLYALGVEGLAVESFASHDVRDGVTAGRFELLEQIPVQLVQRDAPRRHVEQDPARVPAVAVGRAKRSPAGVHEVRQVQPELRDFARSPTNATGDVVNKPLDAAVADAHDHSAPDPPTVEQFEVAILKADADCRHRRDDEVHARGREPAELDGAVALCNYAPTRDSDLPRVERKRGVGLPRTVGRLQWEGRVLVGIIHPTCSRHYRSPGDLRSTSGATVRSEHVDRAAGHDAKDPW